MCGTEMHCVLLSNFLKFVPGATFLVKVFCTDYSAEIHDTKCIHQYPSERTLCPGDVTN